MSVATSDPFGIRDYNPNAKAAEAEQAAAIAAMRGRQAAAKGPVVFLPFGKMQPLNRYTGMNVIPFQKNPFVDRPERILKEPDPTAHYGWARKDDPEVKGKLRSGQYEAVYIDEIKEDNDAAISVSEDVMTERGPNKLVLWHGLMLIRIPSRTWMRDYEEPALMSVARLTQHQQAFQNLSVQTVTAGTMVDDHGTSVSAHAVGGDYRDLRGKVETTMTISDVG
jgi:hypothetical protein